MPANRLSIFVAEDDDLIRELVRTRLELAGFHTRWADNGPEAMSQCNLVKPAALILDIDPIGLVRGRGHGEGLLDHYVNDRPYAASSFLSVALNRIFRTAMTGASRERPELAGLEIPLEICVTPLPVRGPDDLVERLFAPLGWSVAAERIETGLGPSRYVRLRLQGQMRLAAALSHLYVLVPVLDEDKHYWIGEDEVVTSFAAGFAPRPGTLGTLEGLDNPSLLVVQTGTAVSFPNFDTVRHHIYSFSPTKPFEIKLYAGTPAAPVLFDKSGTAILGCNIHDRMTAFIHVVNTPHFAIANQAGVVKLDVPTGDHTLQVWHMQMGDKQAPQRQSIKVPVAGNTSVVRLGGRPSHEHRR